MQFDDFFRCWSFWLGNSYYSYWWLPYQNYYHSVKFANNDFELELGLGHRRSVTCRFPPPQKWDGNQNGSWAAAQSDDSIWRNFPTKNRDDVVHTVRQTQIYAHASFLRRKKGVTDSQFHAVSKPSQNLWFFHEKIHFGAFEVFWLRTRRRGGTGIFCMYLNEIDGVWQLSAYKLWSPGMSSFFKPPKRYFV